MNSLKATIYYILNNTYLGDSPARVRRQAGGPLVRGFCLVVSSIVYCQVNLGITIGAIV